LPLVAKTLCDHRRKHDEGSIGRSSWRARCGNPAPGPLVDPAGCHRGVGGRRPSYRASVRRALALVNPRSQATVEAVANELAREDDVYRFQGTSNCSERPRARLYFVDY
jgi:hypothetical protein